MTDYSWLNCRSKNYGILISNVGEIFYGIEGLEN
jgi:hypothetical protein